MNVLKNQTKAGAFNDTTPQITKPMNHSDDSTAGKKWNSTPGYWTNGTSAGAQLTSCIYCHSETLHNTIALGRPSLFGGNNKVNMTVSSTGSWCASCHYAGYVNGSDNYNKMVTTFTDNSLVVPPEITGNGTYAPTSVTGYFNHSTYGTDDLSCLTCHYNGTTATITPFMHNVLAGRECSGCHFDYSFMSGKGQQQFYVNGTMYNASVHYSLGCSACHITGHDSIYNRKMCECCHSVHSDPKNNTDRHNVTDKPYSYKFNVSGTPTDVVNITSCTYCHNSTIYNNAKNTWGNNCDYCHTNPDSYYYLIAPLVRWLSYAW